MSASKSQSRPVLNATQRSLLAEALQIARHLTSNSDGSELQQRRQQRINELQDTLQAFAHPICREACPVDAIPIEVRQVFVKAVALLKHYYELGGAIWQGTLSSATLSQYQVEAAPTELPSALAIAHLCQQFQLPAEFQTQITAVLATIDRQVAQQKQIIQTAITHAGLLPNPDHASPTAVLTLFQRLFGDIPFPLEAIGVLFTETQIYFCIDYHDNQLSDSAWEQLHPADQDRLQRFLESLNKFEFEKFRHFPTFSFCDPANIDVQWSDHLAQITDLSRTQILQSLSYSVSILATKDAEKFLLHDIWGHNWQSMLTQFRGDYLILAKCGEPLRATETAYTDYGPLTCWEIFQREGEQVTINSERARLFFQGEVRQRLGLIFTHIIGELIADVAEFKFVWDHPELSDQLPCSSSFKASPTKLDFGFADLDFLFLRVLHPLLEVKLSVFEESSLESDLLAEWARARNAVPSLSLRASLKQAIAQLYQIFLEEYRLACLPTVAGDTGIYAEVLANLLHLQNVVNSLCTDATLHTPDFPFQTLLLIFIGCYCSGDSYSEFWAIDDAIAQYFIPCYRLLGQLN